MLVKIINDPEVWEQFLKDHPQQNFLQSWSWRNLQERLGKTVLTLGFWEGNQLQGIALLIKEVAKRGVYLSCPGGPILTWDREEMWAAFTKVCRPIAIAQGAWFVRVRPQILESKKHQWLFTKAGWIKAPMHMHAETTWQLDLTSSPEELLARMEKNHRYEIRKAERSRVKIVASNHVGDIKLLYQLQLETARRHKFVPFSKRFLLAEFLSFKQKDQIRLFKAWYHRQPVAVALIIFYGGEAVYHYAAAGEQARQTAAAYALCWQAILAAKKRGLERFNFWGIAPPHKPYHRFAGLNHFKKGFGGREVDLLPAQDLPLSPFYWLTYSFELCRKVYRRL